MARPVLRLAASLATAALAACAGQQTGDISIVDRTTFIPSARVSVDISPRDQAPSEPHSGHGIELGFSGGSGDDTQTLDAGALPVKLGGQTFNAPNLLSHEFDFRFVELAYRYRRFFGGGAQFGVEALGGLGYAELDLTVASATQRAAERLGSGGVVGGVGFVWRLRQSTSLQSRLTLFFGGESFGDGAARFDTYVAQALGRNAALRAGFAAWGIDSGPTVQRSKIGLGFSGPALGLDVMF